MEKIEVKIKRLDSRARMPVYSSELAAGMDLYACLEENVMIAAGQTVMIPTRLAMEIPAGYAGLIFARSGMTVKRGLAPANKVGVIDADYRGEILVALYNQSPDEQIVEDGERIAQMVVTPIPAVALTEAAELNDSARGAGGFGSTGTR